MRNTQHTFLFVVFAGIVIVAAGLTAWFIPLNPLSANTRAISYAKLAGSHFYAGLREEPGYRRDSWHRLGRLSIESGEELKPGDPHLAYSRALYARLDGNIEQAVAGWRYAAAHPATVPDIRIAARRYLEAHDAVK